MLDALFLRHPRSVGETYGEHFANALAFGIELARAAVACLIHAFVPALFEKTASGIIRDLHHRMIEGRRRRIELGFAPDYQI